MSEEYRCKCCGQTVKEINDKFREESVRFDSSFGVPIFIVAVLSVAIVYGINYFGLL